MPRSDFREPLRQQRWVDCKNNGSDEIPSFAALHITGTEVLDRNEPILLVEQADEHIPLLWAINSHMPIPSSGYGLCTMDTPAWVQYDTGDTPSIGEPWGIEKSTWKLHQGLPGFIVIGGEVTQNSVARLRVLRDDRATIFGKFDSTVSARSGTTISTETFSMYWRNGTTATDTGKDIEVGNPYGQDNESGNYGFVLQESDGVFMTLAEDCTT